MLLLILAIFQNVFGQDASISRSKNLNFEDSLLNAIENTRQDSLKVLLYNALGRKSRSESHLKAVHYYSKALEIIGQSSSPDSVIIYLKAQALIGLGVSYRRIGNYPKALDNYLSCLSLVESLENKELAGTVFFNIGSTYRSTKEYQKAQDYFRSSLAIRSKINNPASIVNCYNAIGVVHRKQGLADSAEHYYTLAFKLAIEHGLKEPLANAYMSIGVLYSSAGDTKKAIEFYKRSASINSEVDNQYGLYKSHLNLGLEYRRQKKYKLSNEAYRNALSIAQQLNSIQAEAKVKLGLSRLASAQRDYETALEYFEDFYKLTNEAVNEEQARLMAQRETEFKFEKILERDSLEHIQQQKLKDLEIEKQNANIGRQQIALLSAVAGLLLILALAFSIHRGKKKSDELLLNILPEETAIELKRKGYADAKQFDQVTVLFTDFKGFTQISERLSPSELVAAIDECFKAFDEILEQYGIEKIKTIGDAYMAAGGLPVPNKTNPESVVKAALEIRDWMLNYREEKGEDGFEIRIGVHTGPVVAGIVGIKKFQYDIWGDTVNTASRMESSGEVGKVNISEATYELLADDAQFSFESRGKIEAKGKGEMEMYFVELTVS